MPDPLLILDRAVRAEAAGRLAWPSGFWNWPSERRLAWARERLGESEAASEAPSEACAHALPFSIDESRKRIGFISPSFAACGGVETWFLSLASRLREFDWLIAVNCHERADAAAVAALSSIGQARVGPRAADLVAANADALIAWGQCETPRFAGPRILVAHGCDDYTRRYVAERESWASERIGVSALAAEVFLRRAQVIHNGVDAARLTPIAGREATRASWGLETHEIALVHFGRIADDKFPSAPAVAVRELGAPYRSVFVGSGSESREFQERIRRLDPLAVFRPPTSRAGDVLAGADVVLCCAPSEGFGLTAVETLAAGRPLVSTPTGAVPEIIQRFGDVCEIVSVRHTAADLAAAVRRAVSRASTPKLRQNAQAIGEAFSAERMAAKWRNLLCPRAVEIPMTRGRRWA